MRKAWLHVLGFLYLEYHAHKHGLYKVRGMPYDGLHFYFLDDRKSFVCLVDGLPYGFSLLI